MSSGVLEGARPLAVDEPPRRAASQRRATCLALEPLLAQGAARLWRRQGAALARPVDGRERVVRTLLAGMFALARRGVRLRVTEVNGQPGAMALDAQDRLVGSWRLDIAEGQIHTIHLIANPRQAAAPRPDR